MTSPAPRFHRGLVFAAALLSLVTLVTRSAAASADFKDHLGLQLWSLRAQAKNNPLAALDLVGKYGLVEVETAGTGDLKPEAYAAAIKARGLKAVSAHFGYDRLKQDLPGVIAEAKALGVEYVVVPSLSHKDGVFDAEGVAADFNAWGEALRAAGLRFGYHPHGFEFRPMEGGGTRFEILMNRTKAENVSFEMDVFWVFHAGVDPVALLKKYPDRWRLMHVKDIRKGVVTGSHTGHAPATDNVPVGQGQIDWPAVLRAARDVGVKYYFIEDETTAPLDCIPASLEYLRGLKL
jgi:sugar phosphate isomerase/epimerase